MAKVIFKESSYEYARLRPDMFEVLARLDQGLIKRGSSVLIKPNLLTAAPPEQAITTHPMVVRAAAEYVLSKGGRPIVGDSPPIASFDKVMKKCGLKDALAGLPVEVRELGASRKVAVLGRWKHIELSGDVLEADVVINLPKLKTHVQVGLTLAVKNLFGCVVGMRKPEWHYRIGEDREVFSELLVTIWKTIRPQINVVDGILAMEGLGPGSGGTPRGLGLLIGSANAVSLDSAICEMVGLDPMSLVTNRKAREMGLYEPHEAVGDIKRIKGFKIPDARDMLLGPSYARGFIGRQLIDRPVCRDRECRLCRECEKMCPAGAISSCEGRIAFDYDRCIKCYCCLEICPHRAIGKHETLTKKALRRAAPILKAIKRG